MRYISWHLVIVAGCCGLIQPAIAQEDLQILPGKDGVEAVFEKTAGGYCWTGYRDIRAGKTWPVHGPAFSVQTPDGLRVNICPPGFSALRKDEADADPRVILETVLAQPGLEIQQIFSFCGDGRTLRIASALRALAGPVPVQRVGLLEIRVPGQSFSRMGPEMVSSPVFGDRLFAGIEHPSAWCQAAGEEIYLAQHIQKRIGPEWTPLPGAVLGSASEADAAQYAGEALRRAFLRYLDTVRVKPQDIHIHYNDWWTAPVPSSRAFVLGNIAALKQGLYDTTGFFFDSYALDMGWSNAHSVWQMDTTQFPEGFAPLRDALAQAGGHVGLWISPSSLYPPALDNAWLNEEGYEVTPHPVLGFNACLAKGGKYQQAFKAAALKHAAEAGLAHMKFDGFIPACAVSGHGHPAGPESWLPIAEGLMEVFDALRAAHPGIALEPTCFGYHPSPWWLMHTPFIIGPFGDDSPYGRVPCPEYIESMTTARDIENRNGRDAFLMPSDALQCFDIIVQCPGAFQNHAVMAAARGRWFMSCYINPAHMDASEWRFFADLMRWVRAHRGILREPVLLGGNPAERQAYGYWFAAEDRHFYFLRNPWLEEATIVLPAPPATGKNWQLRKLYPNPAMKDCVADATSFAPVRLGPYETALLDAVPTMEPPCSAVPETAPEIAWTAVASGENTLSGVTWRPLGSGTHAVPLSVAFEARMHNIRSAECCVLVEGAPEAADCQAQISIDGQGAPVAVSASRGGFGAAGAGQKEHWAWFMTPLLSGRHAVEIQLHLAHPDLRVGLYLRGTADAASGQEIAQGNPAFPLYRAGEITWARTLTPLARIAGN